LVGAWYAIDPLVAFSVGVNVPRGVHLPTLTVSPALPTPPTPDRMWLHSTRSWWPLRAMGKLSLKRAAAVGGAVGLEAGRGQGPGYHRADSRFVLDHKQPLHRTTPPLLDGDPMGAVWQI
jgi:hypothetical protein